MFSMKTAIGAASLALAAALVSISPTTAEAQSFWGGANSSYGTVSFPKSFAPGQIIVSFGDRKLYYISARGRAIAYPIAVPRPQSRWQGVLRVSRKQVNPTWTPTAKMRRENPKLPAVVRGGHPRNPLGTRAIYLGSTLYRIHGTDAPWTIGQNVSRGCIRMHNSHVAHLYGRVRTGMKVTATWKKYRTGGSYVTASSSASTSAGVADWQLRMLRGM